MVQHLLTGNGSALLRRTGVRALLLVVLASLAWAAPRSKEAQPLTPPPDLLLDGGRKLTFERTFSSEREVRKKPGFFGKLVNIVAGEPDYHHMVRPYSVAVDSHGRAIVTDPGAVGVHIFDFANQKYKFIQRKDKDKDAMLAPQCVALDAHDNIYVTDSQAGKVFVFNAEGKYQRAIGSLPRGEGFFKRPTGIAVDSDANRIYITDTLRDRIYVLDMQGSVLQTIGHRGTGPGEFNFPTELKLNGDELVVVDAMNFRVQIFNRTGGAPVAIFGRQGDSSGQMFRPKGVAIDSEGHYYIADALWGVVQIFDREGQLLYYFGKTGNSLGDFQLPAGLFISNDNRIFVVDSFNRRIQEFRYITPVKHAVTGREQ